MLVNKITQGSEIFELYSVPVFSAEPAVIVAQAGASVSFTVKGVVAGSEITYQWQLSQNNGKTWQNSTLTSAATKTLAATASTYRNGYMWRCVVSYNGKSETSTPCKLIVLS